jgi:hypothetical protein
MRGAKFVGPLPGEPKPQNHKDFTAMNTHAHNSQKVKSSPEEALKEILSECIAEFDQLRLDVNRQTRRALDAHYRKGKSIFDKEGPSYDADAEWWRVALTKAAIVHPELFIEDGLIYDDPEVVS